jgi:hypothetical protein
LQTVTRLAIYTRVSPEEQREGQTIDSQVERFAPSEIVALKRAIEPLERRAARKRQRSRGDLCHLATVADEQGDARDKIARYLGVGRTRVPKLPR